MIYIVLNIFLQQQTVCLHIDSYEWCFLHTRTTINISQPRGGFGSHTGRRAGAIEFHPFDQPSVKYPNYEARPCVQQTPGLKVAPLYNITPYRFQYQGGDRIVYETIENLSTAFRNQKPFQRDNRFHYGGTRREELLCFLISDEGVEKTP